MSSVKTTCTSVCRTTCLSNPTGVRFLRGGKGEEGGREGGTQLKGEQDGTNGEIYNNGR